MANNEGKTSVWLPEDLKAAWKASGKSLADLVRLGLESPPLADTAARLEAAASRLEKIAGA